MRTYFPLSLLLLSALPLATASHAAQYCVTSDANFRTALTAAAQSPEADQIRFVRSTIELNANLDPGIKVEGNLQLRGGYAFGCASRASEKHFTRINGNAFQIRLLMRGAVDLDVEQMHFYGLDQFVVGDNVAEPQGTYGEVRVTRSAFREFGTGPIFSLLRHDLRISNSLFTDNEWGVSVEGFYNSGTGVSTRIDLINCTVVNNDIGVLVQPGSTGARTTPPSIVNSIISGNLLSDLALDQPTILRYSMYRTLALSGQGALHSNSYANLTSAPMLDSNFVPRPLSPAIDSGDDSVLGYPIMPPDFAGNVRKRGLHVDRGALEVQPIFVFPVP